METAPDRLDTNRSARPRRKLGNETPRRPRCVERPKLLEFRVRPRRLHVDHNTGAAPTIYTFKRGARGHGGSYYFQFLCRGTRHRRGGFPTKRLAEAAGEALRRRLIEQRVERQYGVRPARPSGSVPTLADYIRETYLPHHLPRIAPGSQQTVRSWAKKLTAQLGDYSLDELGPPALDPWAAARLTVVSVRQLVNETRALSAILNHARRHDILDRHPMHGWNWPKAPERDFRVVTEAEERRLFRMAAPAFRPWLYLALATGMRRGELRLLERPHVDLARGEIRLQQAKVQRVKVIPCSADTVRVLRDLLRAGGRHVLARVSGEPWSEGDIEKHWRATRRKARLPDVRFHDLRHTFATRALEVPGSSVPVVGEILGHKPPYKMTWRYVHALPDAKRRAILGMRAPGGPRIGPMKPGALAAMRLMTRRYRGKGGSGTRRG